MARHYHHLHNRVGVVSDEEGVELPTSRPHIEIADEIGKALVVVPFAEAVEIWLDEESS
jgi:hypothetical protein